MIDCFVRIEGIEGESTDDKHQGWLEALYFRTEVNQKVSTTASSVGGASAERADFKQFIITKQLDKATPKLALACADGTHLDTITIELCRAGTDKIKFMEYKLTNCLISSVYTGGSEDIFPAETVTFEYGKIEWRYILQTRYSGGTAGNIAAGWNLQRNCKI